MELDQLVRHDDPPNRHLTAVPRSGFHLRSARGIRYFRQDLSTRCSREDSPTSSYRTSDADSDARGLIDAAQFALRTAQGVRLYTSRRICSMYGRGKS